MKILGIGLISLGVLGLVYKGFTYTKTDEVAKIGSLEITSDEHKYVWVPTAVAVVAIVAGGALLVLPKSGL